MANAYIHLDSVETLEQYRHKLQDWKERFYAIKAEMEHYHRSLEQDQKWYGRSHEEFYENFTKPIYDAYIQPMAETIEEAKTFLRNLQNKAEELDVK